MIGRPTWVSHAGLPAAPARQAAGEPTEQTRALVLTRADHRCESCGAILLGRRYSLHHRRLRGMGGTRAEHAHSAVNLVVLCDGAEGCHALVHRHRTEAAAAGLIVRAGADPARIPLQLPDDRLVLLTLDGRYVDAVTGD